MRASRRITDAIQLEARPRQPYSVNLWSVALGRNLYIATGREDSAWRDHLDVDNNVRVDGQVYELQAVAVDDHEERQRVVDAYMRKYADEEAQGFARDSPLLANGAKAPCTAPWTSTRE